MLKVVRVQSKDGTKRVQTKATERVSEFLDKVCCNYFIGSMYKYITSDVFLKGACAIPCIC